jgi:hypothetical protein
MVYGEYDEVKDLRQNHEPSGRVSFGKDEERTKRDANVNHDYGERIQGKGLLPQQVTLFKGYSEI